MIVAVVTDLIFSTKITSTAKSVGADVKVVRSLEKLDERLAAGGCKTVLVDLDADGVDVLAAIGRVCAAADRPRIVAYVSHVRADLIAGARQAGADEVMARSAFVAKLPTLLAESA